MEDLKIKTDTPKAKWALGVFFKNYKEQIAPFINNVLRGEGVPSDAAVTIEGSDEDPEITVYQEAPDKGWVLAHNGVVSIEDGTKGIALAQYASLEPGSKYLVPEGDKFSLLLKEEAGKADIRVGHFPNLNASIGLFDSEDVAKAIQAAMEAKAALKVLDDKIEEHKSKEEKKAAKKAARKSKLKALRS